MYEGHTSSHVCHNLTHTMDVCAPFLLLATPAEGVPRQPVNVALHQVCAYVDEQDPMSRELRRGTSRHRTISITDLNLTACLTVDARSAADSDGVNKRRVHAMEWTDIQLRDNPAGARQCRAEHAVLALGPVPCVGRPERYHQVLPAEHEQPYGVAGPPGGDSGPEL